MNLSYYCLEKTLPGINFSTTTQFLPIENRCRILQSLSYVTDTVCHHVVMLPLFLVILISMFNKNPETYRWIIFHHGILNLLIWILYDVQIYFEQNNSNICLIILSYIFRFNTQLGFTSICPLAINRFFFLYLPHFSEKFLPPQKFFCF